MHLEGNCTTQDTCAYIANEAEFTDVGYTVGLQFSSQMYFYLLF